jgi:hypothetical protein
VLKCGVPASSMHCRDWLTQEPGGRPRAWLPITCRSHAASSPKNTGSLVSILQDTYAYAGGAHGMSFTWPLNLAIGAGGPREYGLADVFLAGSGWEKKVSDYVIKSLRTQDASRVLSGEIRAVDEEMLARFAVSPVGIDFYFAPYELGA